MHGVYLFLAKWAFINVLFHTFTVADFCIEIISICVVHAYQCSSTCVIFVCGIYNTIFTFRITFSKYVNSTFAHRLVPPFVHNKRSLLKVDIRYK